MTQKTSLFNKHINLNAKIIPFSGFEMPVNYSKGICPIAESYHDKLFLNLELAELSLDLSEIHMIVDAFQKVWSQLDLLR